MLCEETPAIVVVAGKRGPASLVLPPPVELGRITRAGGATHELDDERMSREHATVRWEQGSWVIRDLDSRNGTFVDSERLHGELRRRGEVILRLGHTVCVLVADARAQPHGPDGDGLIVGPALARAHAELRRLAAGGLAMIEGGAGIGKRVAGRIFHAASRGAGGPLDVVRCEPLRGVADRLIFGGRAGVIERIERIGHLQMARGGTLYLDGIQHLDGPAQARLAGLLAERDGTPGDPAIVCAGNHAELRDDLRERLAAVAVTLPALRTRRVDLIRFVQAEIAEVAAREGRPLGLHGQLVEACAIRPWPGNIAELRDAVRVAAARALAEQRDLVRVDDLGEAAGQPPDSVSAETSVERKSGRRIAHAPDELAATLRRANGSVAAAARLLNLHRSQLIKLLDEAGIGFEDVAYDD